MEYDNIIYYVMALSSKSPSPSINNADRRKSKSVENSLEESMKRTKAVPFSKVQ